METQNYNRIRDAAQRLISNLLSEGASNPERQAEILVKLSLAQSALLNTEASVGNCALDGTDLHFEGRSNGLYVCCAGDPRHCWKV